MAEIELCCAYPGCDNKPYHNRGVQRSDLCRSHKDQKHRGEPLRSLRKPAKFCSIDECEYPHHAKGLCMSHYEQVFRRKQAAGTIKTYKTKLKCCSVEGCDRKHYASGMCKRHYFKRRYHRHKTRKQTADERRRISEMEDASRLFDKRMKQRIASINKRRKPKSIPPLRPVRLIQPALNREERDIKPVGVYGMEGAPFKEFSHLPVAWRACKLTVEEAAWCSGLTEEEVRTRWI